jgi:hypothetical protein
MLSLPKINDSSKEPVDGRHRWAGVWDTINRMKLTHLVTAIILAFSASALGGSELAETFRNPPETTRPGVYWYFMDGNMDRDEMVADLESMAEVGIGSVLFLEVNIGVPMGPVPFMSEAWQDNLVHAIKACERLGMEFILGTGPGWTGSGGSWVKPEDSMQHLVGSFTAVQGPVVFEQTLPLPQPHTPNKSAGMGHGHQVLRDQWYQDVAVLAFPTPPEGIARFEDFDMKTLKDILPYSNDPTAERFLLPQADFAEPALGQVIDSKRIIDLSAKMQADGSIRWEVPPGDWTIMRFVSRSTGQTTRPAPRAGHGFECDKFNADAYRHHWDQFQGRLLEKLGPRTPGKGLTTIHLDSWEMSSQNWTAAFRDEFLQRQGYDPQPYFPAYMGGVVDSLEKTERFLWDMRKTSQELLLEQHAGAIKAIAHEHGLLYSNEPYDMNPAGDLDLGSIADIPVCEFWNSNHWGDTQYSCIEATSIAHTMGKAQVNAEAFTSAALAYQNDPDNMKNQTDWALAMGINGFVFHTFQHQATGDQAKPGSSMGIFGVQWHRNQTWWHLLGDYHQYLSRSSALLRQGVAVADVLYLTPEGVPHIFQPPESALDGHPQKRNNLRDKKGYSFDGVSPRILEMRATVEDGKIAFPGGTSYSLLVLPDVETMTPELLGVVTDLVTAGATVMGNPPRKSPSLVGYPACDEQVRQAAERLWGAEPKSERQVGKGRILLNPQARQATETDKPSENYPEYAVTAAVLKAMGIPEDFQADGPIRYGHRRTEAEDIYFVANKTDQRVEVTCRFRVEAGAPECWNPVTGVSRILPNFNREGTVTSLPMSFDAHQSFFVIFPRAERKSVSGAVNFVKATPVATLEGPWDVSFDPAWGGPEQVTFAELQDWTQHSESGIRYYSGSAVYRKTFDCPADLNADAKLTLDLGQVHDICRVRLNGKALGVVWCAPWQVDISEVVKATGNQLEIEVVNGWVNRMVGDQQPQDKDARTLSWPSGLLEGKSYQTGRFTFSTADFYKVDSVLMPSGLLGPVQLMTHRE